MPKDHNGEWLYLSADDLVGGEFSDDDFDELQGWRTDASGERWYRARLSMRGKLIRGITNDEGDDDC